ncbi:SigE family RNA polymerase sigma factor [Nocardioides sp. 1609]|uniref:RNA polymerase sigma factor n=1 Tax=Nocardioides sp. 1609 TaxID=2508327 RepID=UPI00106F5E0A|nr:SigE family RNA polymerase sigma factor [Nocardioides sp. 1609]
MRRLTNMTTTSDLAAGSRRPLAAGDLAQLYAAHRLPLVRLAILLVDDRASAEDVVQDAFASLAGRLHKLRDPDAALGYLRTSVVNGSRSALRRRRTARAYVPPAEAEPPGPDDRAVLAEEHREVLAGLDRLAPRQREVLVLRYWSGLSEAEIAEACGISRGAVKSTASRALDALEQILKGEGR